MHLWWKREVRSCCSLWELHWTEIGFLVLSQPCKYLYFHFFSLQLGTAGALKSSR